MTLQCGAFGKFGSFMNDDVEEFYQFYIKSVPLYFVQDGFQEGGIWRRFPIQHWYRVRDAIVQNRVPVF